MRPIFIIFYISIVLSACQSPTKKNTAELFQERLQDNQTGEKRLALVKEMENLAGIYTPEIEPDSNYAYFTMLSVNIDLDPATELLVMSGRNFQNCRLLVFKEKNEEYALIHSEPVNAWYENPVMGILNTNDSEKLIYIHDLVNHGTGIYREEISLKKMKDEKLEEILRLPYHAYREAWGGMVSYEISSRIRNAEKNEIRIDMEYRFHLGYCEDPVSGTDVPYPILAEGNETLLFYETADGGHWKADFSGEENILSQAQLDLLLKADFTEEEFANAFKKEIDLCFKKSSPEVQEEITRYLGKGQESGNSMPKNEGYRFYLNK